MSEGPYRDPYEKLFVDLCRRVEKVLVRGIAGALALLLVMQLLLQFPSVRAHLTKVDRLEGVPYRHTRDADRPVEGTIPLVPQRN